MAWLTKNHLEDFKVLWESDSIDSPKERVADDSVTRSSSNGEIENPGSPNSLGNISEMYYRIPSKNYGIKFDKGPLNNIINIACNAEGKND